jgi:hypothetical protein
MSTNADGIAWGMCSAYGCPLIGSMSDDVGGKWYCFCHVRQPHALNDAITATLHRNKPMVERVLIARRAHEANAGLENELRTITQDVGTTAPIPMAPVTGPTHAADHYTESQ